MSNVEVAAALELAVGKRSERTQITADDVLREAWAIATTKTFPAAARVSALALCARHTGGFSEKIEHTGASGGGIPVDVRVVLAGLTHEQVERLADGSDH